MTEADQDQGEIYPEEQTVARCEAALKRMLTTPPSGQG